MFLYFGIWLIDYMGKTTAVCGFAKCGINDTQSYDTHNTLRFLSRHPELVSGYCERICLPFAIPKRVRDDEGVSAREDAEKTRPTPNSSRKREGDRNANIAVQIRA